MSALLGCPHCGAAVRMWGNEETGYFMACATDGCYGANTAKHGEAEAITAWNTRATPAPAVGDGNTRRHIGILYDLMADYETGTHEWERAALQAGIDALRGDRHE